VKTIQVALFFVFLNAYAFAQTKRDYPLFEIFGGYSLLDSDHKGLSSSRQYSSGWEASVSANVNQYFGVEVSVAGYYKTYGLADFLNAAVADYSYLVGPRVRYGPIFVHGLFGGDSLSASSSEFSESQTGFSGAFGGGVQAPITDRYSFYAGADYVFSRHDFFSPPMTENNFRISLGIVIKLSGKKTTP